MNIVGTSGNDSLIGGAGADFIDGLAGDDFLDGGAGNDVLNGGDGQDALLGGAGSDVLIGGRGNDTIDGGIVLDRINYADYNAVSYTDATQGVVVNLQGITGDGSTGSGFATDEGGTDVLKNVNWVAGSAFADHLLGSSAMIVEIFDGGPGDDIIDGGAIDPLSCGNVTNFNRVTYQRASGAVTVDLGAGTAAGADGNDTLININLVRGSNFGDTLIGSDSALMEQFEGRAGDDTIDGRGGIDMLRYDPAPTAGVNVNLATGIAQDGQGGVDTFVNIEGVRGSRFDDVLAGGNPANGVAAMDGFEFFVGGGGNDTIDGGSGYDRADYHSSTSGVLVTLGGAGTGTAHDGLGGIDTLINIEGVLGSSFNDVIAGDSGPNRLEGGAGDDTLTGGQGIDTAVYAGSRANFTLVKTESGFTISGGTEGTDTLTGIERTSFVDRSVALDLEGNAGMVARIAGAVFDGPAVGDRVLVGIGLSFADAGMSYETLMQLALDARLGAAAADHNAVVQLLYQNVIGYAPPQQDLSYFVGLLDQHVYTVAGIGVMAAETSYNQDQIGLAGLMQTGLEYV